MDHKGSILFLGEKGARAIQEVNQENKARFLIAPLCYPDSEMARVLERNGLVPTQRKRMAAWVLEVYERKPGYRP